MALLRIEALRILLLANWGLGLEVLKSLHRLDSVVVDSVVTQYAPESDDKWSNAVYEFAGTNGYQVINQKDVSIAQLKEKILENGIDLLVSHSFMKILPPELLEAPKLGSINIHASLLPKYRGPSPTYWVLKNKEKVTGLTCHYMDEGVDTGDIIYQIPVPVQSGDTVEAVIERQKKVVDELVRESFARICDNNFLPIVQNSENATYAPRPT